MKRIIRIAHRGFSSDYPENTRAAFDAAIKMKTDAIELDIQSSNEGRVFVFHDSNFRRMGISSKPNWETSFSDISSRDIGSWFDPRFSSQRVLSLEDLIRRYTPKTRLLIEIKTWRDPVLDFQYYREIIIQLKDLVKENRCWDKVELLCYAPEVLFFAKKLDERFIVVLNTDDILSRDQLNVMKKQKVDIISLYIKNLDPGFSETVKSLGFPLYTFTCNSEAEVQKALNCNVDAIMSNNILWLNGLLADHNA